MKPVERNSTGKVMRIPMSMVNSALPVRSATTLAGISNVVALRTGNAELTMLIGILITFPVLFLSTGFMPQALLPDWLGTAAQFNPITYLIDALRALVNEGWNWTAIWQALAVTMGLASLTLTAATRAFRKVIS